MAISLRQGAHSVQEQVRFSEQIAVPAVFRSQYVENYHDRGDARVRFYHSCRFVRRTRQRTQEYLKSTRTLIV
jgi:hypothetical protein